MDRRFFLAGAVALPGAALASASPGPSAGLVELLSVRVVNRDQFTALPPLPQGTRLVLRRDPGWRYDPGAIAVLTEQGQGLGYLPPARTRALAALMDAGVGLEARVGSEATGLRVSILYPVSDGSKRGPSGLAA